MPETVEAVKGREVRSSARTCSVCRKPNAGFINEFGGEITCLTCHDIRLIAAAKGGA